VTREELLSATLEAGRLRLANPHAPRGVLVGQAAPANGGSHPLLPFPRNCAGERLFRMSGWSLVDYLARLDRFNTIATFPGSAASGKGDAFPLALARECAQREFMERRMWSRVCLFVGKANAGCYGWDAPALPEPFTPRGAVATGPGFPTPPAWSPSGTTRPTGPGPQRRSPR
jgi:hypothetical protein